LSNQVASFAEPVPSRAAHHDEKGWGAKVGACDVN
jgi:hypothetical protein